MSGVEWLSFVAAAAVVAVSPGANQLLALHNALRHGAAHAVVALAGRFTAFLVLLAATVAGLGALLLASEAAFTAVKWCGVAYLLYLGARLLWRSRAPATDGPGGPDGSASPPGPAPSRWDLTRGEFLVALSNPKAMLLFAAFLPQFTDRAAGAVPGQLAVLGAAYIGVEALAALGYAGVGGRLSRSGLSAGARRLADRAAGTAFLALAASLATARR
ncbi:LysE family translocator [Nocardiopsis sediminis]|uniref:LysE family translocator n=1 Tax=Nocardiopsis sediminis TaxID=1778267 RepID=A0ABV8FDU5_9ACTN